MLKILNRDYKQDRLEVLQEFPGCHFLRILDGIMDANGYVVAISEESATYFDLCNLRENFPEGTVFYLGGVYNTISTLKCRVHCARI